MAEKPKTEDRQDVTMFIKNAWFFLFFFMVLLMIASFGLIAES